jgi:hypothetical protein
MMNRDVNNISHSRSPGRFLERYRQDRWPILGVVLVSVLIALPVYIQRIYFFYNNNDYLQHIRFTKWMLTQQYQQIPASILAHPAYQFLLIGIYWLFFTKVGLYAIAVLTQVVVQVVIAGIIYGWLGQVEMKGWNWYRAALAVTLGMVAPVMIFVFWDKLFYLGYIGIATYHNPTTQLLKPVALVSFICALRVFSPGGSSWKVVLLSALLTVFSALIKPNYLLCILPGMALVAGMYLIQKRPIDWRLMLMGFFIPGVLILAGQFVLTYYLPNKDASSILWMPFSVMSGYSTNLLPKFLLSILFPLVVLVIEFRRIVRDVTLQLAWAGFLISVLQMYLLAESGGRFIHGNFLWGAQVMLLILFVATVRYLWRERLAAGSLPLRIKLPILLVYAAHFAAGVVYYISVMILPVYI